MPGLYHGKLKMNPKFCEKYGPPGTYFTAKFGPPYISAGTLFEIWTPHNIILVNMDPQ